MPRSAKILEGFWQEQEDPNLTVPENAVCLMLLIFVILIPLQSGCDVLNVAGGLRSQSAGSRHRMLGHFQTAGALKHALICACPLVTWVDRWSSHGYSPLGFNLWMEYLWYSLGLAFLLSSFLCWNEHGSESSKISYFRTPQIYL